MGVGSHSWGSLGFWSLTFSCPQLTRASHPEPQQDFKAWAISPQPHWVCEGTISFLGRKSASRYKKYKRWTWSLFRFAGFGFNFTRHRFYFMSLPQKLPGEENDWSQETEITPAKCEELLWTVKKIQNSLFKDPKNYQKSSYYFGDKGERKQEPGKKPLKTLPWLRIKFIQRDGARGTERAPSEGALREANSKDGLQKKAMHCKRMSRKWPPVSRAGLGTSALHVGQGSPHTGSLVPSSDNTNSAGWQERDTCSARLQYTEQTREGWFKSLETVHRHWPGWSTHSRSGLTLMSAAPYHSVCDPGKADSVLRPVLGTNPQERIQESWEA